MGRPKRPKRFNIPKYVAKFDCMHLPGRRQNIFWLTFSGKFPVKFLNRNIVPFMSFSGFVTVAVRTQDSAQLLIKYID